MARRISKTDQTVSLVLLTQIGSQLRRFRVWESHTGVRCVRLRTALGAFPWRKNGGYEFYRIVKNPREGRTRHGVGKKREPKYSIGNRYDPPPTKEERRQWKKQLKKQERMQEQVVKKVRDALSHEELKALVKIGSQLHHLL